MIKSLAVTVLCSLALPLSVTAQQSMADLRGTWTSGSGAVLTGSGFANPVNFTFIYPKNTGIAWSFTEDGYFEQAEYRFNSNGSNPTCITGIVLFQHGKYTLQPNGSLVATPFAPDGRLQVQDPCAAKSNVITQFNTTVLMQSWTISQDAARGPKLQMYQFDGAPISPLYLISSTPNMLPTQTLSVNLTVGGDGAVAVSRAMKQLERVAWMGGVCVAGVVMGVALLL